MGNKPYLTYVNFLANSHSHTLHPLMEPAEMSRYYTIKLQASSIAACLGPSRDPFSMDMGYPAGLVVVKFSATLPGVFKASCKRGVSDFLQERGALTDSDIQALKPAASTWVLRPLLLPVSK